MILHIFSILAVAFATSAIAVRIVLKISRRVGLYDALGPLKIHKGPIPRLGGIGVVTGLLTGGILCGIFHGRVGTFLLLALVTVWGTGFWDDLHSLPPWVRIIAQILAGVFIYAAGLRPFGMASGAAALLFTVLTAAVFINAFNFLDGADGVASGTAAIGALGLAWLLRDDASMSGLALALTAASAGFLLSNFPPAVIFMGDSGSTVLGAALAILSIRAGMHTTPAAASLALLFVAVPLADFVAVILRRLAARRSPLLGDRSHFYDRLLDHGWSTRRVALATYTVTFGCAAIAICLQCLRE